MRTRHREKIPLPEAVSYLLEEYRMVLLGIQALFGSTRIRGMIFRSIGPVRSCRVAFFMCLYSLLNGNADEAWANVV